jgi:hypothetical protein
MTRHIDPKLVLMDNIANNDKVKLAFPCVKYQVSGRPGIRMTHIMQEFGYIQEFGIMGSGENSG